VLDAHREDAPLEYGGTPVAVADLAAIMVATEYATGDGPFPPVAVTATVPTFTPGPSVGPSRRPAG